MTIRLIVATAGSAGVSYFHSSWANSSYTAKYDGKDVQVTGNAPYDTIAIKQANANTLTDERMKTGGRFR